MGGRVAVCRIGQLCGDGDNGVWNRSEAWPLMLGAGRVLGALPRLGGEGLGWLAVDEAARAVLEVAGVEVGEGGMARSGEVGGGERMQSDATDAGTVQRAEEVPVYHILNPDNTRTWDDLLSWACRLHPSLEVLTSQEWIARLEDPDGKAVGHPAGKLIGLWRGAYCGGQGNWGEWEGGDGKAAESKEKETGNEVGDAADGGEGGKKGEKNGEVVFEIENAKKVSKTMRAVKPVSEEAFGRMWAWIGANVGEGEVAGEVEAKEQSKGEVGGLEMGGEGKEGRSGEDGSGI